jgi:two-component system, OmpR family, sensor kinase
MFASLRSRLLLTYTLIIGIVLGVVGIGLIFYILRNPAIDRQMYTRLEQILDTILERDFPLLAENRNIEAILDRIDHQHDVRLLIVSGTGDIIADSRRDQVSITPKIRPAAHLQRTIAVDANNQSWLAVWRPLENNDYLVVMAPRAGRVSVLFSQRVRSVFRDDLLPPLLQAGCTAIVVALLLAVWLTRWISTPLRRMVAATQQFSDQDHLPVAVSGPTEVKSLAQSFNEMTNQLRASQQSQRDFVANVSHELKTPLTSIQGFAQALLDGTADTPEALEQAGEVILAESGRMNRLVLDLLDLARLDAGTLSFRRDPIDLEIFLENIVHKMIPQAHQAQVDLQFIPIDTPVMIGDGDRLAQVFTNLVDNGLKYTPPGGQVTVRLSTLETKAVISIQDSGPGIPPEDLERIFERFYQVDKSRHRGPGYGSGLGLAIVKEIILAHDGIITAQGSQGQGSVFVVKIPLARPNDTTIASKISHDF